MPVWQGFHVICQNRENWFRNAKKDDKCKCTGEFLPMTVRIGRMVGALF
jgi:hypothetical protein